MEQLASPLLPLGQPHRNVAQVDEEPAEAACDVDREMAPARPEPDRVAEAEFGDSRLAWRQVDELEPAGDEVELGRPGQSVDDQPASGVA